jgi:hypothetical protein
VDWSGHERDLAAVALGVVLVVVVLAVARSGRRLERHASRLLTWGARRPGQLALFAGGSLFMLDAVRARPRPRDFPSYELGAGLVLVVISAILPRLRKVKGGPIEVELDGPEALDKAVETAEELETGRPVVEEDEVVEVARQAAGYQAIRGLIGPGGLGQDWIGPDVELRLYTYDRDLDRLMPVVEPGDEVASRPRGWRRGQGVTGLAFTTGRFQLAVGNATHDDSFGLSDEQQQRYRDLAAVAATPVFNASRRVIAVLGASSRDPTSNLGDEESEEVLVFIAVLIGRVLVDLLGWFADE